MVGRDVLGAPRPRDAHGTPTGTPHVRGPPRTSAPTMPHPCPRPTSCRHHMVGRDVLGAPRTRDAHWTPTGTPRVHGPPGTSAPTMPHPCPRPVHTHGRARRPRRAAHTGRPWNAHGNATCTRAAEDVGPYHASPMFTPPRPVRTLRPVHTHGRARRPRRAAPTGRPRNAHRDAHGDATCIRAAEDVGPYHASRPVHTPRPVHTHWRVTMSGGGLRISAVSVRSF